MPSLGRCGESLSMREGEVECVREVEKETRRREREQIEDWAEREKISMKVEFQPVKSLPAMISYSPCFSFHSTGDY